MSAGFAAEPVPFGEPPPLVLDEIRITGSLIAKPDFAFPNPVISIDANTLRNAGTVNLTSFLKEVPALTASSDSHDSVAPDRIGAVGLEALNLHNLGTKRTLVLVDGRRHVAAAPGSEAVDIDTLPLALIDFIEISTGGASAIYGADGVSGVVNFVMKRDFDGLDVRVQNGASGYGDADSWIASAVGGRNFDDGRGNFTAALEYTRQDRLEGSARKSLSGRRVRTFVDNPDDPWDSPSVPDLIALDDVRYSTSSPAGAVDTNDDAVPDFNGTGLPFAAGRPLSDDFQQGGDGTLVSAFNGDLLPQEDRYTVNTLLTYRQPDSIRAFGEFKYSRSKARAFGNPTADYLLMLQPDNPYLPVSIAAASAAGAADPDPETNTGGVVYVSRDHFDLGVRGEDIQRDTIRSVIGLDGPLSENANFQLSVVYGQTDVRDHALNNRFTDRFHAALDAVRDPSSGRIVCRSNLDPAAIPPSLEAPLGRQSWAGSFRPGLDSGCVPINIFGNGSVSPEAAAWINAKSLATSRVDQAVFQAVIDGRTFNGFAPDALPMGYALGIEHRREASRSRPAREDQQGLTYGNVTLPARGDYEVAEAFLEVDVPLVDHRRFADYLGFDAAVRGSEYSTIGTTRTWTIGGTWAPVKDVRFRGSRAKATRAPNIAELFRPGQQTFEFVEDPCAADNLQYGSPFRRANCEALLKSLGVDDPAHFTDPNPGQVAGSLKGNPGLNEEDAHTTTFGIVLQPRFSPGLSLAIDWYDIAIENAINTAFVQDIADQCVNAPSLDNAFCNAVQREPGTAAIVDFTQRPMNVARFTTRGYDLNLNYRLDPATIGLSRNPGIFNFRLLANKLEDLSVTNLPGTPRQSGAGTPGAPEWQASFDLAWEYGNMGLNYGLSYFNPTQRFSSRQNPDIVDRRYLNYDAKLTHDLAAHYQFTNGLSLYGGVNNVTDQRPDVGETFYPVSAVGRYFYTGLQWSGQAF